MKAVKKQTRILEPEDLPGAMMQYKPMTKEETAKVAEWVATRKARYAKKQSKTLLKKIFS